MMAKWVALREISYVDATVPSGAVLDGVSGDEFRALSHDEREAFRKRKQRLARDRPDLTLVAIRFGGKVRWVNAPEDVRMHLAAQGGSLRRRRTT